MTILILPNPINGPTLIGVDDPGTSVPAVPVADAFTLSSRTLLTVIDHWTLFELFNPMFDT